MCLQLEDETRISAPQGKHTTIGCDDFKKGVKIPGSGSAGAGADEGGAGTTRSES